MADEDGGLDIIQSLGLEVDEPKRGLGGMVGRLRGRDDEETDRLLEAYDSALRYTWRELEDLGWQVLNAGGIDSADPKPEARKAISRKAKTAWMQDPQAGAVVALTNDFVLGRGIPVPRAKDELVQKVIDNAFADPDNKRVLTTYAAQVALNTDLTIQDNLFVLAFNDGLDGKFKLGLLQHDLVKGVVRDPDNYLRILYYVASESVYAWDFNTDQAATLTPQPKTVYYEAWGALDEAKAERENAPPGSMEPLRLAPASKVRRGQVYHVALNRMTDMAFGYPEFARSIRWMSAHNDLLAARVDMAKAVASLIMKRKVKGTPGQLARTAAKYLSRESPMAAVQSIRGPVPVGPANASVIEENENVTMEPFNLDSRAGNAQMDVRMIGGQVSAAHRFPRSYLGDQAAGSLATATSLELPVLRFVESRQEVIEQLVRWFVDAAIEKAVDDGKIPKALSPEEVAALAKRDQLVLDISGLGGGVGANGQRDASFGDPMSRKGMEQLLSALQEAGWDHEFSDDGATLTLQGAGAGYSGQVQDEQETLRDLSYNFTMPSPLRRQMAELVSACTQIVQSFDPDNTNVELSRAILAIALTEALEVADAADIVERCFPPGYKTLAQKQFDMQAAAGAAAAGPGAVDPSTGRPSPFHPGANGSPFPTGEGGQQIATGPDGRPANARMNARPPELAYPQLRQALEEGRVTRRRDGGWVVHPVAPRLLVEGLPVVNGDLPDLPEDLEQELRHEAADTLDAWDRDVVAVAAHDLARVTLADSTPTE